MSNKIKQAAEKYIPHYVRTVVWDDEDNCWIVRVPEIAGVVTHGDTAQEAFANSDEAILGALLAMRKENEEWPVPLALQKIPTSYPLRLKKPLFIQARKIAKDDDLSLNEFIANAVAQEVNRRARS